VIPTRCGLPRARFSELISHETVQIQDLGQKWGDWVAAIRNDNGSDPVVRPMIFGAGHFCAATGGAVQKHQDGLNEPKKAVDDAMGEI